jgi:cyclic beta-1,2-glucan synthetase
MLSTLLDHLGQAAGHPELAATRDAGHRLAESISSTLPHGSRVRKPKSGQTERILVRALSAPKKQHAPLLENARLLRTAEKQSAEFVSGLRWLPQVRGSFGDSPRVCLIASAYLDVAGLCFGEETCAAFLDGFQDVATLQLSEIWGLKPALEREILKRLETTSSGWSELVTSLRHISEASWKDLFESVNIVDRTLARDPAGVYWSMDFDTRERYRSAVADLAEYSHLTESEVAAAAVDMAQEISSDGRDPRAILRRRHVGFYLIDSGLPDLKRRIGYKCPLRRLTTEFVQRHSTPFYLVGIELVTFFTVVLLLGGAGTFTAILVPLLMLLLPATQTAVDFMNHLATFLVRPRVLPKLDFSEGVPADCATMVAVPTLLLNEAQVHDLALDLEIRFLANHDPNIYFALVTDSPDSDREVDDRDRLVHVCSDAIELLNRRYPGSPFFLFHRHRTYNDSEGRWMGWERKRGKLLDLNQLLRGGFDAFPVKIGNLDVLPNIRYVLTLDSDTQLPRDTAAKLIGAIAHPLNVAVIDPVRRVVVEGYGILQSRIGISIRSAARSRLAALYSGETGFDIYTRAVSDVYQDLFGEAIFTGKGIYEVDVMRAVLERRFPDNALLSHDLIEGAYARVALVSDIELIDDYPSHFSAYNRRRHRWLRGDWQILRWILPTVPDNSRNLTPNPITLVSQWKILDNLRRSLLDPSLVLLLLGGWFLLPGAPGYWTAVAMAALFLPVYCDFAFALLRIPHGRREFEAWVRGTLRSFANGHAIAFFALIFLLHQALLSLDAITRSVLRVFVTRRKLLEWETAAEAEVAARSKATVDTYLEFTPWIALLIGLAVWLLRPAALPAAAPVLVLWLGARGFSAWLNRAPRAVNRTLDRTDTEWLRAQAEHTARFFQDWSSETTNWLIPDSVSEDGAVALRLSPTNLGFLLNARIAMVHFGLTNMGEFIFQTRQTLDRLAALPKYRGHLLNWYDISTLQPLEPQFVSTVDSGNLAAALWTLKQAALAFAGEPGAHLALSSEMVAGLKEIAARSDALVRDMDFRFLYHSRKKVLSVGYNVSAGRLEPSYYDLLASEARIAVFVAIAKSDIPQEAWFHLGRAHTLAHGKRILLSWTGTMFEYLMPALWMRHYPGTITAESAVAAVRVQQEYCTEKGVPWGISESAFAGTRESEPGYAPFGVPGLAMKQLDPDSLVVAPYASFLALMSDSPAALKNLRRMEDFGWVGRYGFYEAVDYSQAGARVVRTWMAHHQGMALLALANALFDYPLARYFHDEPQVLATELLLHERVPAAVAADAEPAPLLAPLPLPAQA